MSAERKPPSSGAVITAVARVTFREVVRDKVLYNVLLAAVLLFGFGFLASRLSTMDPGRVILDFGLSALSISSFFVGVLVGAGLLGREFERRTIHVAFSHPIGRLQFVVGKFMGLVALVLLNWGLMSGVYLLLLWAQTGSLNLGFTLASAIVLVFFQTLVISATAIFFSSFSTTSLSVMLSLGVYLIGINNSEIRLTALRVKSGIGRAVLNFVAAVFPDFEHFNLGSKLTYDLPVTFQFVGTGIFYALLVSFILVCFAGLLVQVREV